LNAVAQGNIYIESTNNPINVRKVDAGQSNVRLLGKHGVYSANADGDQAVNISGNDLIIEGGDNGAAVSKIGDRTVSADLPLYVSLTGSLEARADGLVNIYQQGASPLTVLSLYSGSDVWLHAEGGILSAASASGLPEGYINADGKLSLVSDTGGIGRDGQGLRVLADNVDGVEAAAAGGIYLESESKATADLTMDGLAAGAAGEIELAGTSGGFYFAGNVSGKDLTIEAPGPVGQDAANSAVNVNKITAAAVGGFAMGSAGNSINALEVENLSSGDIVFVNNKDLAVDALGNTAAGGGIALTALGEIDLKADIAADGAITIDGNSIDSAARTTVHSVAGDVAVTANTGGITLRTVLAGTDISLVTYTGDISIDNGMADRNVKIAILTQGDLNVGDAAVALDGSLSAGNDIDIIVPHGSVTADMLVAGVNTGQPDGDINVQMWDGDFQVYFIMAYNPGSDINIINNDAGNIDAEYALAGNSVLLQTDYGNIITTDILAGTEDPSTGMIVNGNVSLIALNGEIIIKGEVLAGGDDYIYVGKGDFYNAGTIESANGHVVIRVGAGDIAVNNIEAHKGISLETIYSGDVTSTGLLHTATGNIDVTAGNGYIDGAVLTADQGSVYLAAFGGQNGIDAQEIIAARDVKASAGNGDITIVRVEGADLWFGIYENGHTVEITDAFAAKSLLAQGEFVDIIEITHTAADDYFQLALRGAGGEQPMTYAEIDDVISPVGVQLDQLWAEDAYIHVSSEYFRIMDAYAINKAYLSNSRYRMTMFGRDPVPDDADIQIYFAPIAGNPFAHVSFQNEFSYLGLENYQILHAKDGVVNIVTNQRSLLDDTAITAAADVRLAWRGYAGKLLADTIYDYGRYLSLTYGGLGAMPLDGIYRGGRRLWLGQRGDMPVLYYDDASGRQSWQILNEKRKTF
ncbi:MAG: hypothetical protein LBP78_02160, partial [Acidaminococcales bacterium]|nr:hypothetical protein [Acidaminococcales bacterium]